MKSLRNIVSALFLMLCSLCVAAQQDTTVCFVNVYPGPEIYELEGHSAIAVFIDGQEPVAYNFGVFDFNAPNFVYRFVKGETDYKAVEMPWKYFLWPYFNQQRRVVAHELNFDSGQKARLISLLRENVKPENATYRYNYVKDNCATRPLRAVETAAGDSIRLAPGEIEANSSIPVTFRNVMRHYHRNYPWYQFGIDLALGHGLDAPIDSRELAFAPAALAEMAPEITSDGKRVFADGVALTPGEPEGTACGPTPWWLTPIAAGTAVALLALALSVRDILHRRLSRWFDCLFYLTLGLAGCIIAFLVFISTHYAASPNWLLLWINPLCLAISVCIWFRRTYKALAILQWLNLAGIAAYLMLAAFGPLRPNPAFFLFLTADAARALTFLIIPKNVFSKKA